MIVAGLGVTPEVMALGVIVEAVGGGSAIRCVNWDAAFEPMAGADT